MKKTKLILIAGGLAAGWLVASVGFAGELVYLPANPSFGGNPFNAAPLLSNAQAQNSHTAEESARVNAAALRADSIADRVDRLVLNGIASGILGNITDSLGNLIPGTINTGINTIVITDLGTQLEVVITNNATGEVTIILVPN